MSKRPSSTPDRSVTDSSGDSGAPALPALLERLPGLMLPDQRRLGRRLDGARRIRRPEAQQQVLAEIAQAVEEAELRVELRRASVPAVTYPAALPVSQRRDAILEAVRDHQVVIVAGETGSGKTTQLPKICMELGRGVTGMIGHTQPRRIAARTVAQRVADEVGTPLGETVGWKVRFTDQVSENTLVKLMTDGILLAEIQQDRELRQYDTIIIDEAHERSLNIDFLLGYLAQLLPRRPELKVIITSATIDPERFARHFRTPAREPAPIVEVSGRTYPVEVRYRPLVASADARDDEADPTERDQTTAICDAVDELRAEAPGDVLVFLSGEREIRDAADALEKKRLPDTEVLPLYARLSHAEQQRVFQQHRGRRIVLATNVAETSLTVPGIKYVIDPGTARISRYSHRTKVQRLPIEPISQASADQRKGRCGRTSDGICIRLYSEEDFAARPEYTDPEIVRTNLASVILQMTSARLGEIEKFPFIDPPDRRAVTAGVQLLEELHALDGSKRLTDMGRKLSQLPVDPRLARMVLEADRNGCVHEVMVIAAALSVQDPRERPADKQQQADEHHNRFREGPAEESDFLALLNLWEYLREQQRELSSSAFRRRCRAEFLNFLRIREWQDIYAQLRSVARSMGISQNSAAADPAQVHQSLLAGLLSQLGLKDTDKHEYLGARGAKFAVFPGSALFRKPPRWVMSAELVETSRLWARVNARIDPEWIEPLAEHLVKRNYSEPHWEQKQAAVMAYERVTLYGIPVVAQRKVAYGRIDPEVSRELFIRHALVEGDWRTQHAFFRENRKLLEEVEELEHRARRRDILVDDETLFDFYDQRVPDDVVSGAHFDAWWKKKRRDDPDLLSFEKSMLINEGAGAVTEDDYPDVWQQGRLTLPVTYQFEPGTEADGVTVHLPIEVLNQVADEGFDWQIPGLREQLVTELIRSLPKQVRRRCVPAPDYARRFLAAVPEPTGRPITVELAGFLQRLAGTPVSAEEFQPGKVPAHLRITFRVVSDARRRTPAGPVAEAEDKDLVALVQRMRSKAQQAITRAFDGSSPERGRSGKRRGTRRGTDRAGGAAGMGGAAGGGAAVAAPPEPAVPQPSGLTSWTLGPLQRTVETRRGGQPVRAYPALVDEGSSVAVRLFDSETEQREAMARGTRRLVLLHLPSDPAKFAARQLDNAAKLTLAASPHGSVEALLADCTTAAVDELITAHGGPAWDEASFHRLAEAVRADAVDLTVRVVARVREVLAAWQACQRRLKSVTSPVLLPSVTDVRDQLARLVPAGFVTAHGVRRLPDLLRYLTAADRRLQQLPQQAQRDAARMAKIHEMQDEHAWLLEQFAPGLPVPVEARRIRWMIEELRVSYFAHALGTAYPVSDKRIVRAVDAAVPEGAAVRG